MERSVSVCIMVVVAATRVPACFVLGVSARGVAFLLSLSSKNNEERALRESAIPVTFRGTHAFARKRAAFSFRVCRKNRVEAPFETALSSLLQVL